MKLVVISPEKKVLEAEILSATLPTPEGQITILPHHQATFTLVSPGEIIVRTGKEEIQLAIGAGFANISGSNITLLCEFGVRSEEIDEEKVKEAQRRAAEFLRSKTDETGSAKAEATMARAILELKIAQKRRTKS